MNEVSLANLIFGLLWVIAVFAVFIFSGKSKKVHAFKVKMIGTWKYSLVVAILSYICPVIGSGNLSYLKNFMLPIFLFCECLIGFAISKSIKGYEPLPVTKACAQHRHQWGKLISVLVYGLLITVVILVLDQFIPTFGETRSAANAVKTLPQNKWLLFFTLLYGAGFAEETVYRLIFLSAIWKITNKKWLSIILSALIFGAYHLTPLNQMYRIYWTFPINQFVSAAISGIVFGYIYTKRGYETAVVGHTLSDWLPILIFMK